VTERAFQNIRQWLRRVVVWVVAIAALLYLNRVGGFQLIAVGVCWGIPIALGMESCLRSATQEAWERKQSKLSKPMLCWFWLFVLSPACVAIFWNGPFIAVSPAMTILFAMALVVQLCTLLFGFRQIPKSGEGAS
jgi:hypothetical protein